MCNQFKYAFLVSYVSKSVNFSNHTKDMNIRAKTIQERLHSVERNSNFEIAALFHHLHGKGKSAAILKLEFF